MRGNPPRQIIFGDLSRRKAKDNCGCSLLRCIKINSIEPQKYDHRRKRSPFVAINERVIARNTESIGCRENGKISFSGGEFVYRPRERGFKKPTIADAIGTAKKCKLLGMKIKNDVNVKPTRLAHLASAL